ncbi:MAG: GuaB [Pseudomonadota bacterium]|jgi:IMP dehydrogenase
MNTPHISLPVVQRYTFDDVLLSPRYSNILPSATDITTQLHPRLILRLPIIAAAMDTVTEARMAIALAHAGGLGVVHKNLSAEEQAAEVLRVKRFEAGVLRNPLTVSPNMTVADVKALTEAHGFSGFPVLNAGELVGLVTSRDLRFETRMDAKIIDVMTTRDKLVTLPEGSSLEQAQALMHQHKLERIVLLSDAGKLAGLVTVKDLQQVRYFPLATRDTQGRLQVAAAVGTSDAEKHRAQLLVQAGVDILVVDTAHGHSEGVLNMVRYIKTQFPEVLICGGNIATAAAALALADAGADIVKVGIGPGSICTTRIVSGVGVPQLSAVYEVAQALQQKPVTVIADGGIRYSGDVAKALAAGAHAVMLGSLLAGTDEAPGEVQLYAGRAYKSYRGMGSIGAMKQGSADRYFQKANTNTDKLVPEGIEGRVPYKGSATQVLHQMAGGLRSALGYCGSLDLATLRRTAEFTLMTSSGMRESHVHDVIMTQEAPNYQRMNSND